MKNQPDALRSSPVVWEELRTLRDSIPLYASWRVRELEDIFRRYLVILMPLSMKDPYDRPLRVQVKNIQRIKSNIENAIATGLYVPYNRAMIEIIWDIEAVMEVLMMD